MQIWAKLNFLVEGLARRHELFHRKTFWTWLKAFSGRSTANWPRHNICIHSPSLSPAEWLSSNTRSSYCSCSRDIQKHPETSRNILKSSFSWFVRDLDFLSSCKVANCLKPHQTVHRSNLRFYVYRIYAYHPSTGKFQTTVTPDPYSNACTFAAEWHLWHPGDLDLNFKLLFGMFKHG